MMIRRVTTIDMILGNNLVNVAAVQAFGDMAVMKYYELTDSDITAKAVSKGLDTWAEPEVCECIDEAYPLIDPVTNTTVVTTYAGQP